MDVEKDGDLFSVTLYHDDSGEDGYANWWQVETMDGEKLGRRELLHSHGTRNFTRSSRIEVPEGVEKVVVRGHDQTHGYGGRAITYEIDTGGQEIINQGSEPIDFSVDNNDSESSRENDSVPQEKDENTDDQRVLEEKQEEGLIESLLKGIRNLIF